jgi:vitamin B12 transporter
VKKLLFCGAALCAFSWSAGAAAQERALGTAILEEVNEDGTVSYNPVHGTKPIVVIASRGTNVDLADYEGSISFINSDDIENRQTRNIEDVLRDVPGVAVSSVPGMTQVRLRGAEANHVLVLVDGIEVSDPGSGEYDIGTLQAEIGSRLEVLRGPQSALYGSEAVAGVIAYDSGRFDGFSAFVEGGTNDTINGAARWGVRGDVNASLSATIVTTNGEPNARASTGGGIRDIGRDSYTLSGKLDSDVSDNINLRAVARYTKTEGEFNDQDFGFGSPTAGFVVDSPGNEFANEVFSGLLGANLETAGGDWVHDLSVQFTDANRQTVAPAGFPSSTESDRFKASYVSAYRLGGGHSLTLAADYETEGFNNVGTFDDRKEAENIGLVGEYRYSGGDFDLAAAIRHDFNDLFKDATTFRVGAGYDVSGTTRLRAAVGTGVKNPSMTELFGFFDGVFIGNPNLKPEKSTSWEVGLDQGLGDDARVSATYFNAKLDDEIFTTFPAPTFIATPGNRDTKSKREGVELALSANLGDQVRVDVAYTYLDSEENSVREVRRPKHTGSAAVNWQSRDEKANVNLVVRHNGEMTDTDFTVGFPAGTAILDDFTLVNVSARHEVTEGISLFARAENLLDEKYEQVFTFVSPGRQLIAGLSAKF